MTKLILPYARLVFGLLGVAVVSAGAPIAYHFLEETAEAELLITFFVIALIFAFSFAIFYLASGTAVPSFVVAIFFGMAAKPMLEPVLHEEAALTALVGFGATLILFGGGLETPFANFRKLIWKILSVSFIGLFITAVLFSLSVYAIGNAIGSEIPVLVAILLGAVLASTDPAAIIPILKRLRFKNRLTKDIIISESAVTDVTGTLLTVVFLALVSAGTVIPSILGGYGRVFSQASGEVLVRQLAFGVLFGLLGWGLLELLARFKKQHEQEFEADSAFFLFIPVMIFTVALALGGSGYLAAFVAGLLFNLADHLPETERFFNHMIDGFFKPTIFLLLGALVDFDQLFAFAALGILAAAVFMFIIRPIAVFTTLGPFSFFGKDRLTWRELLFISFVRETGAIPAVLLVTIVSLGIPGLNGLVAIGMWVILLTLIVEPPLTPYLAKVLNVATPIGDEKEAEIETGEVGSFVVLGTRGRSFIQRLPMVSEWARRHNIHHIVVLLCLEYRYTKELVAEIEAEAEKEFAKIPGLHFRFLARKGFLQQNVKEIAKNHEQVVAIFVGRKMLDYRLDEIKKLPVPLYFME